MKRPLVALLLTPLLLHAESPTIIRVEAESGRLRGDTRIAQAPPEAEPRTWVTGFVHAGDGLDLSVTAPAAGDYLLEFTYSADGDKNIPVCIGDNLIGSRRLPKTTGFETRPFGRVHLAAGDNRLSIGTDWGYVDIDSVQIRPAAAPVPFHLAAAPVTPNASAATRALYQRLTDEFGRRTFSGQHESDVRNPSRLAQVAELTDGRAPAILGLDCQLYSQTWTNPESIGAVERALAWAKRGGMVTLSWHWLSPFGGKGEPAWDTFSTNRTDFDASRVVDTTSPEYAAIITDLDRIAEQLKRLRDTGVPVLWRPLHEAEGRWFWWGAKGPETARALYRLMFDRFTKVHRLDNLLWVWTTTDNNDALDWYPGDDYVDIVAADLYAPAGAHGDFSAVFDRLREQHGGRKPIALGECGALPAVNDRAPWLWFLCWDDLITRPDVNPPKVILETYTSSRVITASSPRATTPPPLPKGPPDTPPGRPAAP